MGRSVSRAFARRDGGQGFGVHGPLNGGFMIRSVVVAGGMGILSLAAQGCGAPEKIFEIKSFPPGAMIYVEGQDRGQTDQKVAIQFAPKNRVTVRIQKTGFQTTGMDLDFNSPAMMTFFLQEAPRSSELIKELREMKSSLVEMKGSLVQISDLLGKYLAEKSK